MKSPGHEIHVQGLNTLAARTSNDKFTQSRVWCQYRIQRGGKGHHARACDMLKDKFILTTGIMTHIYRVNDCRRRPRFATRNFLDPPVNGAQRAMNAMPLPARLRLLFQRCLTDLRTVRLTTVDDSDDMMPQH